MSSLGDVKNRKWGHDRGYLSVSGDMSHRDMLFSSFFSFFYNQILVFLLWILSFRRQPASATAHSHSCDTEPHRIGKAKLSWTYEQKSLDLWHCLWQGFATRCHTLLFYKEDVKEKNRRQRFHCASGIYFTIRLKSLFRWRSSQRAMRSMRSYFLSKYYINIC